MIIFIQLPPQNFNIEVLLPHLHGHLHDLWIFHAVEGITSGDLVMQFIPLGGDLAVKGSGYTLLRLLCCLYFLSYDGFE